MSQPLNNGGFRHRQRKEIPKTPSSMMQFMLDLNINFVFGLCVHIRRKGFRKHFPQEQRKQSPRNRNLSLQQCGVDGPSISPWKRSITILQKFCFCHDTTVNPTVSSLPLCSSALEVVILARKIEGWRVIEEVRAKTRVPRKIRNLIIMVFKFHALLIFDSIKHNAL